jgi:hypothetical protein
MFLEKNSDEEFSAHPKKIRGKEFSGKEFSDEECSDEESFS